MNSILNERNLNEAYKQGQNLNDRYDFNCWGATLFVLGRVDDLHWAENEEMADFIENETEPTKPTEYIEVGDILVLFENERILHTAVYLSEDKLFHKVGGKHSEFTDFEGVTDEYDSYDDSIVVRVKKN